MIDLEVRQADVTKLEVDAITNAANTELRHGGGVAAAISRATRSTLRTSDELACRSMALVARSVPASAS